MNTARHRWLNKPPLGYGLDWSHPLARGLVNCYLFAAGSGNIADDLAGANSLTLQGSPAWSSGQGNYAGTCLALDGATQYGTVTAAAVKVVPFTIAGWFNVTNTSVVQTLASLTQAASTKNTFRLQARGDLVGKGIAAYAQATGNNNYGVTTTGYTAGTWFHAAAVYTSGASRTAYLNAGSPGTNTTTINPSGIDTTMVGAVTTSNTPSQYTAGSVGHVLFYNRDLTAAEIGWLYEEPWAFLLPPTYRRWFVPVAAGGGPATATLLPAALLVPAVPVRGLGAAASTLSPALLQTSSSSVTAAAAAIGTLLPGGSSAASATPTLAAAVSWTTLPGGASAASAPPVVAAGALTTLLPGRGSAASAPQAVTAAVSWTTLAAGIATAAVPGLPATAVLAAAGPASGTMSGVPGGLIAAVTLVPPAGDLLSPPGSGMGAALTTGLPAGIAASTAPAGWSAAASVAFAAPAGAGSFAPVPPGPVAGAVLSVPPAALRLAVAPASWRAIVTVVTPAAAPLPVPPLLVAGAQVALAPVGMAVSITAPGWAARFDAGPLSLTGASNSLAIIAAAVLDLPPVSGPLGAAVAQAVAGVVATVAAPAAGASLYVTSTVVTVFAERILLLGGRVSTGQALAGQAATVVNIAGAVATQAHLPGNLNMAMTVDITCYQGEDLVLTVTLAPVPVGGVSGWDTLFTLRVPYGGPVLGTAPGSVSDAVNGIFSVSIPAVLTNQEPAIYDYDFSRTDTGAATVLTQGSFTVLSR